MPRQSTFRAFAVRLLIVSGVLLLPVGCGSGHKGIHPHFVDTFIDVNRHGHDRPVAVAFEATKQILAVGRESGRVELWDTTKDNARLLLDAHSQRTEHIAFGSDDDVVLTSSEIDQRTKVWDVHSGALLHEIDRAGGPAAPSPIKGIYLVAGLSGLMLYDHAHRALIGPTGTDSVTAITADAGSALVAVGTASGSLQLLKMEQVGTSWQLTALREAKPFETGDWIQAVSLRDAGKNLVSVATSGAVVEWDVATLQQKRALPTTLRHVSSASFTPNEPWVVLSGTMDSVGVRDGKVELVDLSKGEALRFKANTNMPTAVLLPEISVGLILQTGWVRRIRYLDQSG